MSFNCSFEGRTKLTGIPVNIIGSFSCTNNKLTDLVGSPKYISDNFYCWRNELTSLIGSPKKILNFECQQNFLIDLTGSPDEIKGTLWISQNKLTSLNGCPKKVNYLKCYFNDGLVDVSDLWENEIKLISSDLNCGMAILPLVKFEVTINNNETISTLIGNNKGKTKLNILNLQRDLIEAGYKENAIWKPKKVTK